MDTPPPRRFGFQNQQQTNRPQEDEGFIRAPPFRRSSTPRYQTIFFGLCYACNSFGENTWFILTSPDLDTIRQKRDQAPKQQSKKQIQRASQKNEIEKMVQELLNAGVIFPSMSPYSSPVVMVLKKEGS
jgi:hypothetical protein